MKKLFAILGTIGTLAPTGAMVMAMSPNPNIQNPQTEYSMESFGNIIKIINAKYNDSKNIDERRMNSIIEEIIPTYYSDSLSNKTGDVITWKSNPKGDKVVIDSFENTVTNNTSLQQQSFTQSRTETVTESHTFSISLAEKISISAGIKGKFKMPLGMLSTEIDFNFNADLGSEQEWGTSKTVSVTKTDPSQPFNQPPHTIMHVLYSITQQTVDYEGIARFEVRDLNSKTFNIPIFHFNILGGIDYITWTKYSINEIARELISMGYSNQINDQNKDEYSVISIVNENSAFINLPITWTSQIWGFDLTYNEEQI